MLRLMERGDLPWAAEAETLCFSDPWTLSMIEASFECGLDVWLMVLEKEVPAGYCVLRVIAGEGELLRIGVIPSLRGLGYGKKLMDAVVETSRSLGVGALTLEVREGNKTAGNLYKSYGFSQEAVRKGYYHNPDESAIIMWNRSV